ncbi:MAG: sarcosine oxidase subunit delta [Gammaproteobacteria bacterium]
MLELPCPFCGLRYESEFAYGGDAEVARPNDDSGDMQEWLDYVFVRNNPRGEHKELWHHVHGCRQWMVITRHTETHEITNARPAFWQTTKAAAEADNGKSTNNIGLLAEDDKLSPDGDYAAPVLQTANTKAKPAALPKATNRLSSGGRIDRAQPVRASFDGKALPAYRGDTLASAMLAAGQSIIARSFKYHRPRGIYSAGAEEPCALIHTDAPNTLATTAEVYDGISARGQNAFPNVRFDINAAAEWLSPFIAAGFYYKTFIGPFHGTKWWMFCEKYIRRAAGMGRAEISADDKEYEKTYAYCDILIIGGGAAGLSAALTAGRSGAAVVVAEQDFAFGGQMLSLPPDGENDKWLRDTLDELRQMKNVRLLKRAMVFGSYEKRVFGIIQTAAPGGSLHRRLIVVRAKQAILASGKTERPQVFANNDRPSVMLANAARMYLNRYAVLPGKNIIVATNNDSALLCARDLAAKGAKVLVTDSRPSLPDAAMASLRAAGADVRCGVYVASALGRRRVSGARVVHIDSGKAENISCDLLAVSGGWNPLVHLWMQRGGKLRHDIMRDCFVPEVNNDGIMHCAGGVIGDASSKDAALSGIAAAKAAASNIGAKPKGAPPLPSNENDDGGWHWQQMPMRHYVKTPPKAFLDLQHDVTLADMDLAYREGYTAAEHAKRYTTAGMAIDQGKTSAMNTAAYLARLQGGKSGEVSMPTFRPPYMPISIGAMSGRQCGMHLRPVRRTAIHRWHRQNGAVFIEASAWLRPRYYPQAGEDMQAAVNREVNNTRQKAGIIDVGTLGKIAVQGADAVKLLNLLYVNDFANLQSGRLRYGVMLREDGFVMDDGATAKIADGDYFMTTTTANAARVLAFAEKMLQTQWQNLRVNVSSISDQWAAFALAGPNSRALLAAVMTGFDINAMTPNAAAEGRINDTPVRIHRLSFSGELAFEIYAPSAFALAVWRAVLEAGAAFGLQPYGTEAMGVMRIEKGHPTGAEIDGRITLDDMGFGKLAADKPFVGAVLRRRPALQDARRHALVGLITDGDTTAPAGSLVFLPNDDGNNKNHPHGDGWLSSSAFSPTLNKHIALAFVKNGKARRGEVVRVADILGGKEWRAVISPKCFYDPTNSRQNA